MTRFLLSLILIVSVAPTFGEELDGRDVVRSGLRGLNQHRMGASSSSNLGGFGTLVGFGLWTRVFENWKASEDGIRTELGDVREFVRDGEDLIARGLTLAQLVRLAYPKATGELTADLIVKMALRPFANQLGDLHSQLEQWRRDTMWVNLGDTCAIDLTITPPGP